MIKEDSLHYNSHLEALRFVLSEVWFFVFPGEVSPEELARNTRLQVGPHEEDKRIKKYEVTNSQFRFLARISPEFNTQN